MCSYKSEFIFVSYFIHVLFCSSDGGKDNDETFAQPQQQLNVKVKAVKLTNWGKEAPDFHKLGQFLLKLSSDLNPSLPQNWISSVVEDRLRIVRLSERLNPTVQCSLGFTGGRCEVYVHDMKLPDSHPISSQLVNIANSSTNFDNLLFLKTLIYKTVSEIDYQKICHGVSNPNFEKFWPSTKNSVIEKDFHESAFSETLRSLSCSLLIPRGKRCSSCATLHRNVSEKWLREEEKKQLEASSKKVTTQPHSTMNPSQLKEKLMVRNRQVRTKDEIIRRLRVKLRAEVQKRSTVSLDNSVSANLKKIFTENAHKLTKFQTLFWEEQLRSMECKNQKAMRWHPMIIRFALSLRMKSSSSYEDLRTVLNLPSVRTLFDYSHYFDAKEGIQYDIIGEIAEKFEKFEQDHEKYVALMFDEINVKCGLVYHRGRIVGCANLNSVETEMEALSAKLQENKEKQVKAKSNVAKKILALMVSGITTDILDIVAYFPVKDLNHIQLHERMWDTIRVLEKEGIGVLVLIGDGASVNRKFFKMESTDSSGKIPYKVLNRCSPDDGEQRYIYFLSDPSHLIKTVRNCAANSGAHKKSRYLWIRGKHIRWQHWIDLYNIEKGKRFRKAHKLTASHVYITSHKAMKVNLATQSLSLSAADAVEYYRDVKQRPQFADTEETVIFMRMFDAFFDIFNGSPNVGNTNGEFNKPNLRPFSSVRDDRFDWLQDVFLKYLEDWESSVASREGDYSKKKRSKMLLSRQTREGIEMSITSLPEIIKFLIKKGAREIYARKLSQDKLENYFSKQRSKGGSCANPTVLGFSHNVVSLHAQGSVAMGSKFGNTQEQSEIVIDDTPLKKRKTERKSKP